MDVINHFDSAKKLERNFLKLASISGLFKNDLIDIFVELGNSRNTSLDSEDPADWLPFLLGLCFNAAGGTGKDFEMLELAWVTFTKSAKLFDAVEDNDTIDGLNSQFNTSELTNHASGMLMMGFYALDQFLQDQRYNDKSLEIKSTFYKTLLNSYKGQALELSIRNPSLEDWWKIARAKSGEPFFLACWSGARLASDEISIAASIGKFGYHLGHIIQILDDVTDFLQPDIFQSKRLDKKLRKEWSLTLPMIFA
ncbi:MAG: class 1 isoprenoid biosynthesis enzyme, partial [Candidatus Promineifilaceae bacterium]|nr:class 1 isoprenoid biosynthesis enzyme [Candidatus Promineifilaceae bacterium]